MVVFHNTRKIVRLPKIIKQRIKLVVRKNKDKYDNESHFIRCAIIKLLKEEELKKELIDENDGYATNSLQKLEEFERNRILRKKEMLDTENLMKQYKVDKEEKMEQIKNMIRGGIK